MDVTKSFQCTPGEGMVRSHTLQELSHQPARMLWNSLRGGIQFDSGRHAEQSRRRARLDSPALQLRKRLIQDFVVCYSVFP